MDISMIILYIVFGISILLYIAAAITILGFVIPLQIEQTNVKNGLIWLRHTMLRKEFLSLVVIVASIIALTARFFTSEVVILRYLITFIIFVHAAGTFGKARYDRQIYTHSYSDEQKDLHARMEVQEKKEDEEAKKHKSK